jgi:hypothetical protein
MYLVLTVINVIGCLACIYSMVNLVRRYYIAPRTLNGIYGDIIVFVGFFLWQSFTLTIRPVPVDMWPYKLVILVCCISCLYRSWAKRFTSIKKDSKKDFFNPSQYKTR